MAEPKRIVKCKCYKCGARFEADSFDELEYKLGLKKDKRGYYCDCKQVGHPAEEARPKKEKAGGFSA